MEQLELRTEIGEGKDIEVAPLFEGSRRKLVQITLRRGAVLTAHQAAEPITIQCIAGAGEFVDVAADRSYSLQPGVLITVESNTVHEVRASPQVSILLTKFLVS